MKKPRLFYFCFDHNRPTGGNKQIYRHVDILNRNGYEASVLHSTPGFRLRWLANETRTTDLEALRRTYDPEGDILVLPEDLGGRILAFPGRKVILNQSVYYGFAVFGKEAPSFPYLGPQVIAVLTKSEHNAALLRFAYPGANVIRVFNGVDPEMFRYRPPAAKQRQIACAVKAPLELSTLYHVLLSRAHQGLNNLHDFRWVFLEDRTEAGVAEALRDSLVFVFLSVLEGMALAPIEALLSGCLVVAFAGGPLPEYLPPECQVAPNDLLGAADRGDCRVISRGPRQVGRRQPGRSRPGPAALPGEPGKERPGGLGENPRPLTGGPNRVVAR